MRRIEEFCRANDVIGLPDDPLEVTWTPVFMRAYGRAFLESPGVLDKGLSSHFWITPPDESQGPQAVESYLREENDQMLRLLAIHEGVPGHYLQLAWANRTPNLARGVFQSGMFAEGWAVYVTQVMMDLGYGDFDPALLLNHWKFYLRAITNAMMDVAIHTGGMTEQAAMDMMVRGGFQEEDEARAQVAARAADIDPAVHLLPRLARDVGDGGRGAPAGGRCCRPVAPTPSRRSALPAASGETAGFDYRAHLESVISHGAPPIKWVSADHCFEVKFGLILPSYREGASTESIDAIVGDGGAPRLGLGLHDRPRPRRAVRALRGLLQHLRRARHRRPRGGQAADPARRHQRRRGPDAQRAACWPRSWRRSTRCRVGG